MNDVPESSLSPLVHDDVRLILARDLPAEPARSWLRGLHYDIRTPGSESVVGGIDLRIGYTTNVVRYAGHFGYFVHAAHRGHGYAAKACLALAPLARQFGMDTLYITCNPDNWASRKTCERLGAVLLEIVDLPADNDMYLDGERQKCRYRWTLY